jgi:hypothetical protein
LSQINYDKKVEELISAVADENIDKVYMLLNSGIRPDSKVKNNKHDLFNHLSHA